MNIRTLRWRLAKRIAPVPIIEDQFAGADGAFVVIRRDGTVMQIRAARFRMRTGLRLRSFDVTPADLGKSHSYGYFAGTVAR